MHRFPALFTPGFIGGLFLKNRIVMSPMFVGYAHSDGQVSSELLAHYEARARGGVGLIIVEAACVDVPFARDSFRQINIDNPRYVAGLERLARGIKAYGSRAFIQLLHTGRQASSLITGHQPVAPSPIACSSTKEIPRELTLQEIGDIEEKFLNSARYANMAGFDGVELHAAHGYLLNQFLSLHTNRRMDEYGGSLENRMRLLLNIVRKIKNALPGLVLSVRLNLDDFVPGGLELQESIEVARHLENSGVDVINCSTGTYESGLMSVEPASFKEGWRVYLAEELKKAVKIPVITGGMISDPAFANQVIEEGKGDYVFFGRTLLADSEWANKVREGSLEDIRPCIRCNNCIEHVFKGLMVDCTVNPRMGREGSLNHFRKKAGKKTRAVVVGSGPAGMQAALALECQGLSVSLYEKDEKLGGLLNLACIPPHKEKVAQLRDYLIGQLRKSKVEINTGHTYEISDLKENRPDYLIIATGSNPSTVEISGSKQENCLSIKDVLEKKIVAVNKEIVIVGGGINACEVADFCLEGNNNICIIEEKNILAIGMEKKNRRDLLNRLQKGKVQIKTSSRVERIEKNEVIISGKRGNIESLTAELIIMATGFTPSNQLFYEAQNLHSNVFLIGDAFEIKGFKNAILQGEMLARSINNS